MNKTLVFDMDGTLGDFYGVEGWLEMLMNADTTPYAIAKPLVNLSALARVLNRLQRNGYTIGVISWLAKVDNAEYNKRVAETKLAWLAKHLPSVKWDNLFIVHYGTPKHTLAEGYLFDDEEKNRREWGEGAFSEKDLVKALYNLLKN